MQKPWFKQIREKAIITGFVAGFFITSILNNSIVIMFRTVDIVNHDYSAFSRRFHRDLSDNPEFIALLFMAGCMSYMLAALIAGRFSRGYFMTNAMVLAGMFALFDIIMMLTSNMPPDWSSYGDLLSIFPFCYAGAKLAERNAQ